MITDRSDLTTASDPDQEPEAPRPFAGLRLGALGSMSLPHGPSTPMTREQRQSRRIENARRVLARAEAAEEAAETEVRPLAADHLPGVPGAGRAFAGFPAAGAGPRPNAFPDRVDVAVTSAGVRPMAFPRMPGAPPGGVAVEALADALIPRLVEAIAVRWAQPAAFPEPAPPEADATPSPSSVPTPVPTPVVTPSPRGPQYVSRAEVAKMLGVHPQTLDRLVAKAPQKLPGSPVRVGTGKNRLHLRWRADRVSEWIEAIKQWTETRGRHRK